MKKIVSALLLIAFTIIPLSAYASLDIANISIGNRKGEVESLELKVDELVKRVESAKPSGTAEEQRTQFRILDKEIDILESEIDLLEDRYEFEYLTSVITQEEYRSLSRALDRLDDRLDKAEDTLEQIFYKRN